jgi:hypothetical protein
MHCHSRPTGGVWLAKDIREVRHEGGGGGVGGGGGSGETWHRQICTHQAHFLPTYSQVIGDFLYL